MAHYTVERPANEVLRRLSALAPDGQYTLADLLGGSRAEISGSSFVMRRVSLLLRGKVVELRGQVEPHGAGSLVSAEFHHDYGSPLVTIAGAIGMLFIIGRIRNESILGVLNHSTVDFVLGGAIALALVLFGLRVVLDRRALRLTLESLLEA